MEVFTACETNSYPEDLASRESYKTENDRIAFSEKKNIHISFLKTDTTNLSMEVEVHFLRNKEAN